MLFAPFVAPLANGTSCLALLGPWRLTGRRDVFRELQLWGDHGDANHPRLISIENFKVPHFELVDAPQWLCHRYDKNMEILSDIRTEQDCVAFLKSVAEQLLVKARVKLNLKNLYASNGFKVRELLKVSRCGLPCPCPCPHPYPSRTHHPSKAATRGTTQ